MGLISGKGKLTKKEKKILTVYKNKGYSEAIKLRNKLMKKKKR